MRSKEQLDNLRKALCLTLGPYAFLAEDRMIDDLANRLQLEINDLKTYWKVKIRAEYNHDSTWPSIQEQPNSVESTFENITISIKNMMVRYPSIEEVMYFDVEDSGNPYILKKGEM